jgi:hypothetical protein
MLADAEQRGYVTRIPILTHDKVEGRRANTLIPAWLKRWIIGNRPVDRTRREWGEGTAEAAICPAGEG